MSTIPEQILQTTAFGEQTVANKDPEIQVSAQYDTSDLVRSIIVAGGTTEITGGEFVAHSGTDAEGIGVIFTDDQIISKPGQGSESVMSARFDVGVANERLSVGPTTASDGMQFGYDDGVFGVTYRHSGRVQIEELTITTPASGDEATTITINGTGFTVDITAGTTQHNAAEIAASLSTQNPSYNFTQNDNQVVARSVFAAPESGAFSFSSPGDAVASWSQVSNGALAVFEVIAQADWNQDTFNTLNPENINTYKWVHNGVIEYSIFDGVKNEFVLVHRINKSNTSDTPMFSTASFRLAWVASNQGSTTDNSVRGTFAAAFNQGARQQLTGTQSEFNTATAVTTTSTNLLTIRCREVFGTKVNLGRIIPIGVTAATDSSKGAIIQVIKNATFADELNFSYQDKSGSIAEIDKTNTAITGGEIITSFAIFSSISIGASIFKNVLLPGDTITLAMNVTATPSSDMSASAIWEEDL